MRRLFLLAFMLALLAGCGDGSSGSGACGATTKEVLDPQHLVHVLPSAPEPEYISNPPTSGPHQPAPELPAVVNEPIARPIQVGVLERGGVLVQYQPDIPPSERDAIIELAGDGIVVAPQADLPDPVVATAWLYKLSCGTADVEELRAFADARLGKGPEG